MDDKDIFSFGKSSDDRDIFSNTDSSNSKDIFSNAGSFDDKDLFSYADSSDEDELYSYEDSSDNKDIFSYDNSLNAVNDGSSSFDLNSYSSRTSAENDKKPTKKKKPKKKKRRIAKAFLTVFLIGVITVSLVVGSFLFYAFTMIDGTVELNLNDPELNFTTTIFINDGKGNYSEYKRLHGEFNRKWMDYNTVAIENKDPEYKGIPQMLANAFIAIEDKRFATHYGVDWKRTFGALINEFVPIYSSRQGGSTITQQLVKNITEDKEQKASRKLREIMRARYLESHYSKDTILECYLNIIPMGKGLYGVEVAANYYFGKSVSELTLLECASLASITKAPEYYSPEKNPENNKERRNQVLYEMLDQGYINKKEYEEAKNAELKLVLDEGVRNNEETNSYFVDALIDQVIDDLAEKYGYTDKKANELFYSGGYNIYATVDSKMQSAAESVFADTASYAIKSASGKTMTGAITVMDYKGNVKAIVGGIGKKEGDRSFNNATDAVRQPGSTMKPIAAYAPAIESNLISYSQLVNDTRINYKGWTPNNWYRGYRGNVTVQKALEISINAIPVYLVNKLTPEVSYDFLTQKLGVTTLTKFDKDLSPLGMGGTNGGLTTLESAAAYAIFGNGGRYYEPTFYSKVTDQDGRVVLEHKSEPKMAISEDTSTVMNHLLQTVVYGKEGTGSAAKSYIKNMKIFAKTGTSNDQNDLWFVGGTPYYVASCWCGFEVQEPIPRAHSGIALKMWGNVMSKVHAGLKAMPFSDSSYAVKKQYCESTGLIANEACPKKSVGWYRKNNIPAKCTKHVGKVEDDKNTSSGSTSSGDTSSDSSSQSSSSTSSATSSNSSSSTVTSSQTSSADTSSGNTSSVTSDNTSSADNSSSAE